MGKEGEEKRPSFRMSRSFNLRRIFEGPRSPRIGMADLNNADDAKNYSNVPKSPQPPSDADQVKERFAKLLLGEDMSGGGKGVSSALALSNAITNLAASVFGEQKKLEPMSPDRKMRWRKEIDWLLSVTDHIVEFVPALRKLDGMLIVSGTVQNHVYGFGDIASFLKPFLFRQNGRSSLGDSLYKNITDEYFDPEKFLSAVDKSHWTGMPPTVSAEKREMFEERAETILAILKQRFPGLPQFMFFSVATQDVGHAILESYSRTIESLAHTVMSRIDGVLYADQLVQSSSNENGVSLVSPRSSGRSDSDYSDITKSPRSPSLSQFMGWNPWRESKL